MATDDKSSVDTSSIAGTGRPEIVGIARWVLGISGFGIIGIATVALLAARGGGKTLETSQTIFNALLPLFGTWVGTVLAYYFSSKNFETASNSVERMVTFTLEQKLGKLSVEKEMLHSGQVTSYTIPAGKSEKDVPLQELLSKLKEPVTRIPIVDPSGAVKYILHQSSLYKFLAEQAMGPNAANLKALSLDDLVRDAMLKDWVTNIVFIPASVTVAEAKSRMEAQKGCQDLVVTQNGSKTEPMLGWMTNVDIGRLSKA